MFSPFMRILVQKWRSNENKMWCVFHWGENEMLRQYVASDSIESCGSQIFYFMNQYNIFKIGINIGGQYFISQEKTFKREKKKKGTTIDPWTTLIWIAQVHLHANVFHRCFSQHYLAHSWLNPWMRNRGYGGLTVKLYMDLWQCGELEPLICCSRVNCTAL